jgi:Domain of unknown function (DUF5615)
MARFYSNENFSFDFVVMLRALGHDVLTSYDAGQANQGIPDDEVLQFSIREARTVITFNRDDFVQLHRSGIRHCGIIVAKDDRDYAGQVGVLQDWLAQGTSLNDRCLRVKKQNQAGSKQQHFVVQDYER